MQYFVVAIGGFFGSLARFGIGQWCADLVSTTGFPWGTLIVNLLGCFVLSLFLTLTLDIIVVNPVLRLGFSTGFIGSFTTFSTFSLEVVQLFKSAHFWYAGLYIFCSIFLCLAVAALGVGFVRVISKIKANGQTDK